MIACTACDRATSGARIPVYDHPQIALVVLDLQRDFLAPSGRLPVAAEQVDPMLAAANALVHAAAAQGVEVVYVRNEAGGEMDPRVRRVNERLFTKQRSDAFSNPSFDSFLRERGVDHLVLAGAPADRSVLYTAQAALNRGYKVQVVRDAVAAATDRSRDGALASLRESGVELIESERAAAEWARRKRYLGSR